MRKHFGVTRYEWAFSFPEPDWWGTIFRDVGAQSVGKRSEVSEILRSVFVCRIRRILLSRHGSSRRDTNPAFSRRVSRSARMFEAIRSFDRGRYGGTESPLILGS